MLDMQTPAETATPSRRRLASQPTQIRLGPLLAVEISLFGALAILAAGAPPGLAYGVAVAGTLIAVLRFRGRWVGDLVRVWLRYRLRARQAQVMPKPTMSPYTDRSGAVLALLTYDNALEMVLAVRTGVAPIAPGCLEQALGSHEIPLTSIRTVSAYRRGGGIGESHVVLRLQPADCPAALLARGGGAQGAHRALSAVATGLARQLGEQGQPARVLGPAEMPSTGRGVMVEKWDHCQTDGNRHVAYRMRRWPANSTAFQAAAEQLPCDGLVTTQLLERAERGIRRTATVRLINPPTGSAALTAANKLGFRLMQLDGEHATAFDLTNVDGGA